jgi:hypothetical protein
MGYLHCKVPVPKPCGKDNTSMAQGHSLGRQALGVDPLAEFRLVECEKPSSNCVPLGTPSRTSSEIGEDVEGFSIVNV